MSSIMKIGTSERVITPDTEIELCGYLSREQPSTGKYDDLYVRTLYIENAGNKIVWIHCDLIGFSNELAWHIRNTVAEVLEIDAVNVVLSATHTQPARLPCSCGSAGRLIRLILSSSRKPS